MSSALLPGDLTAAKGRFTCKGDQLSIKDVNANVGKSSISDLAAKLKWGKHAMVTASSAKTAIFLDEVYPWLQSHKALRHSLKNIPSLTGTLAFQKLAFTSPISGKTNKNLSLSGGWFGRARDSICATATPALESQRLPGWPSE
jgi:hypothetical protein